MLGWIKKEDKIPQEHQRILATVEMNGKTSVVPCWFVADNRILLNDAPNSQTYSFSMVRAWQPFPEPYQE
ncbi:hypothetical protein AAE02nite_43240 [Adhaeribacter aerolatus]|uniref:DUF551 domain-containing protein n=1 Tax=Adhaeribacter aerolatus TaxID=670289 RepID=A0A512B3Y4_9BACT|nr:DUF551 domain-containing protein [Adhaeribacter aerolatus]GEO06660.1 hypothetical protein AAE02nite_43240 [Adhaeribacter aerolatus]